jgi:UDP-glucose 4-epimerase
MRVFITGIGGFLGHHIAMRMHELGYQVAGNDTFVGGEEDNVPSFADFTLCDCCDFDAMKKAMEGCDLVYHCAATAHEGLSVFSPSFITRNIFEASVTTFSAAIAAKVKRIVFCTSMARYGEQQPPFKETMTPAPVDPYGIAKVAAEDVLKVLGKVHNIEWNIAVPHNIVGENQKYDDPFRNVMSIMLNRNLQGKPSIIYGDGTQTRCFSYVDDCVQCLEKMGTSENIVGETINIGPDEQEITIGQLAELCANETGLNEEPIYYTQGRPQEVKHATCSSDKARKLLGYKTTTTVEEAVTKTANWIREKGTKPFKYHLPLEIINEKTPKTWTEKRF